MDRIELYKAITGDNDLTNIAGWMRDCYLNFCEDNTKTPNQVKSPNGSLIAVLRRDEHEPFDRWLFKKFNLELRRTDQIGKN